MRLNLILTAAVNVSAITADVARGAREAISKGAAYTRTAARTLLKRRKGTAPAGSPPNVHTSSSSNSLRNIRYGYDEATQSAVIAPVVLPSATQPAPDLQEFGGNAVIIERRRGWRWVPVARGRKVTGPTRRRSITYAARPFMGPSLEAKADSGHLLTPFAGLWAGEEVTS